jgi:hypothetical protein
MLFLILLLVHWVCKLLTQLAAKFLEDSINSGKNVVLRSKLKDSKGKYGRVLGEVVVGFMVMLKFLVVLRFLVIL